MALAAGLSWGRMSVELERIQQEIDLRAGNFPSHFCIAAASRLSRDFEWKWAALYQLLREVREKEYWRNDDATKKQQGRTFSSFEDYFENVTGQSFRKWAELEETFHFLGALPDADRQRIAALPYPEARKAQALAGDPKVEKLADPHARPGNQNARKAQELAADPKVERLGAKNAGDVGTRDSRGSNGVSYLVRRLKRDAPSIADALAAGVYPSARSAGIAAGIVKVPSNLSILRRAWSRASQDERDAFLAEIGAD